MTEEWRPISGWPYEVSSLGNVRRVGRGRGVKPGQNTKAVRHKASGYLQIQLWSRGSFKTFQVNRLVAEAFLGPCPAPGMEAGHINGDRLCNAVHNLKWCTHLENMRDRDIHGTTARGFRNGKRKHSDERYDEALALRASGLTWMDVSKEVGIPVGTLAARASRTLHQGDPR